MFELHQKWWVFLQLAAEKKTPFLVQLKQIFGPSYFDRSLLCLLSLFLHQTLFELVKLWLIFEKKAILILAGNLNTGISYLMKTILEKIGHMNLTFLTSF